MYHFIIMQHSVSNKDKIIYRSIWNGIYYMNVDLFVYNKVYIVKFLF